MLGGAAAGAAVGLVLGAQQVVEDVDDGGDVPLGLAISVLQGWVEGAGEGSAVHSLAVVVHGLYDGALAVGRPALPVSVLLRGNRIAY